MKPSEDRVQTRRSCVPGTSPDFPNSASPLINCYLIVPPFCTPLTYSLPSHLPLPPLSVSRSQLLVNQLHSLVSTCWRQPQQSILNAAVAPDLRTLELLILSLFVSLLSLPLSLSTLCAAYRPHFKTLLAVPPLYIWLIEQRRPAGTEDTLSVDFLISCVLFSLRSPITSSPSLVSLLKISFSPQNPFRSIVWFPLFCFVFFFYNFIPSWPGSHRSGQHPLLSATREPQPGRTFSHRRSNIVCPTLKPLRAR